MSNAGPGSRPAGRSRVLAWALWDCGSTGLIAIVLTFVFSVYLTDAVGTGETAGATPASWLGRAMTVAGLAVALIAPVTGVWVDAPRRRQRMLAVLTAVLVILTASMSLIRDDPRYLWAGLALLAVTAACNELASVPYNAMLRQFATPESTGRISGLGSASGYFGSVTLLLVVYAGFIAGDGPKRGLLKIPIADGQNVRAAMLLTAAWMVVFALPLLVTVRHPPELPGSTARVGVLGIYRKLWSDIRGLWRTDRNVLYFLLASAVFRDGLAGVFTFAAVLGVSVYGISPADVLLFGVAASVVAALGAVLGGVLDDHVGSKAIIVASLASILAVGAALLALSGPAAFWTCGLLVSLFIGPAQASARALILRMTADGMEGVAFGLYTMTGRALSFIAPFMFFTFIDAFGADRAGLGGLLVMLAAGLIAMVVVRVPRAIGHRANAVDGAGARG